MSLVEHPKIVKGRTDVYNNYPTAYKLGASRVAQYDCLARAASELTWEGRVLRKA